MLRDYRNPRRRRGWGGWRGVLRKCWNRIAENIPNLGKETVTQVQEAQSPITDYPQRSTPRNTNQNDKN